MFLYLRVVLPLCLSCPGGVGGAGFHGGEYGASPGWVPLCFMMSFILSFFLNARLECMYWISMLFYLAMCSVLVRRFRVGG